MAATYTPIASISLGLAASTVTFNSIPQTYTDLVITIKGRTDLDANIGITFNSDSGNNYSMTAMYGNGSTATGTRNSSTTNIGIGGISSGSDEEGTNIVNIMNYSNTNFNKSVFARANNSTYVQYRTGLWRSTSAITAISITSDGTTFMTGATFDLHGIKAGTE